ETERCSEDTLLLGDVARAVVSEEHAARAPVAADEPAHDAQPDDRRGLGVLSARHAVRDVEHEFEPSLVSIGLEPDPGTPEVPAAASHRSGDPPSALTSSRRRPGASARTVPDIARTQATRWHGMSSDWRQRSITAAQYRQGASSAGSRLSGTQHLRVIPRRGD